MKFLRSPEGFDHLPGRKSARADVEYLAGTDQVIEGPERFVDRNRRLGTMDLVEVDPVGLQPPEARLAFRNDVRRVFPKEFGSVSDIFP